jgi:hypothetical protein
LQNAIDHVVQSVSASLCFTASWLTATHSMQEAARLCALQELKIA